MSKSSKPKKKVAIKRSKGKAAEIGVSAAQAVFAKVLQKADPRAK